VVRSGAASQTDQTIATIAIEATQLGFVLSQELLETLRTVESDRLARFASDLLKVLARRSGADKSFNPLYAGFPEEVVSAELAVLYLNALEHYFSMGTWRPPAADATRVPLADALEPTVIGVASRAEFDDIVTRLAGARSSLSPTDVADLDWFVRQQRESIVRLLPETMLRRENTAIVGGVLWKSVPSVAESFIERHLSSATDLLRWWVAISGGDVSLAKPSKLVTLPRRARRIVMGRLELAPNLSEDMWRRPERWKRLGERLHPREFEATHPKAAAAFKDLRDGLRPNSLASRIERALSASDADAAMKACLERPGEFARRLDVLLRTHWSPEAVSNAFGPIAHDVATPLLLQLIAHFDERQALGERGGGKVWAGHFWRNEPGAVRPHLRVFLPKGQTAKLWARVDTRPAIASQDAAAIVERCEAVLRQRFAKLPPLGPSYVDPILADYSVPLTQRSSSRTLRTIARGSRLDLPDAQTIRLFLWWTNGRSRTDIDLSASLFNDDYRYIDVLSYYNLTSWGAVHSGDIVDAPQGAAEFIDLDTHELRKRGIRYVVATLSSFTTQPYCDLPECFAGWMARSKPGSGEVFEARTVADRVDLTAETTIAVPMMFDLVERKVLWTDLSLRQHPRYVNAVGPNLKGIGMLLEAMNTLRRPNLYTLFSLHARARGGLVETSNEAATVFSLIDGVTPFDIDVIRSEFL
jgi:hypothetical protein